MRDKLIELMSNVPSCDSLGVEDCRKCKYREELDCKRARTADFLIANGVTLQQWIPVSERLPEKTGYYLVHHKGGFVAERYFYEEAPEQFVPFGNEPVTHWMPMPEPPKEGE